MFAAGVTITVTHDLDAARPAAVIAVPFHDIDAIAPELRMYHVVVRDPKGRVLPTQITNYQHDHHGAQYDDLVFSYDFAGRRDSARCSRWSRRPPPRRPARPACTRAACRSASTTWPGRTTASRTACTAFALNSPAADAVGEKLRGSGIDVWGKRVTYPIVDRWYAKGHDQFHKDGEGEGLDLYSIGGSRGDGGTGAWDGTKLWTSDNFAQSQVLSNGPRRAVFRLDLRALGRGRGGQASRRPSRSPSIAGVNFDTVESTFDFAADEARDRHRHHRSSARPTGFPAGVLTRDPEGRWMSLWEENEDGGLGVAVILDSGVQRRGLRHEPPAKTPGYGNHLLLVKARDGVPVRYFTGAGWNRSGQFSDRARAGRRT